MCHCCSPDPAYLSLPPLCPHVCSLCLRLSSRPAAYDVSDNSSYNGGITSGLGQRLVVELLAGLSLTKRGLKEGDPVRPNDYKGTGSTLGYGNPDYEIPKRD